MGCWGHSRDQDKAHASLSVIQRIIYFWKYDQTNGNVDASLDFVLGSVWLVNGEPKGRRGKESPKEMAIVEEIFGPGRSRRNLLVSEVKENRSQDEYDKFVQKLIKTNNRLELGTSGFILFRAIDALDAFLRKMMERKQKGED